MTRNEINNWLLEHDTCALLADGLEGACIGFDLTHQPTVAIYDYDKVLIELIRRDGMTLEEAEEFFDYNIQRAADHHAHGPRFIKVLPL